MFEGLFRVRQIFELTYFDKIVMFLGSLLKMYLAKYWKITKPSGHTVGQLHPNEERHNFVIEDFVTKANNIVSNFCSNYKKNSRRWWARWPFYHHSSTSNLLLPERLFYNT